MNGIGRQIDRSTGSATSATGAPGQHARRLLLVAIALLLAACSSLKLGYYNADSLLLYSLDSYLDLDDSQKELAGERVRALLSWHRATQLRGYAQLIADAQRRLDRSITADEVAALQQEINARLAAIGERAAPDLALLALTLTPAQIAYLADKLARDASKARRELARFSGAAGSIEERVKRYTERADSWFGSVSPEQARIIRASVAARPDADAWWIEERERRQRDALLLARWIHDEKPPVTEATRRIRDYLAELAEPRDDARRAALAVYRRSNAELIARLVNAATPAQRTALAKKLRGYADDLTALAAAAGDSGS
ncbi:MAG: DUF6279 family lipoprotein [Gemmatimonadota bacterium]